MEKLKVTLKFEISLEGFESKEQAIKYYTENQGDLYEILCFVDDVQVTLE